MATDPWGLTPADVDPPAIDPEIGVTTGSVGESWAPPVPRSRSVSNGDLGKFMVFAGASKLKLLTLHRGWLRRKL